MVSGIHPAFVHFPIALLTVYAGMEVFRFTFLRNQSWWTPTKAFLLILGTLGTFAAIQTGQLDQQAYRFGDAAQILELHEGFATATSWFFSILSILYVVKLLAPTKKPFTKQNWFRVLVQVQAFFLDTPMTILLGIIGFALITITGALGAALVYGPTVDPAVQFITSLLGVA